MWFSPFHLLEELSRNDMSHVVTYQYGNPIFFLLTTVTCRGDPSTNYTACVLVQSNSNNFYFYVVADYSRLPPFKINWLKITLNLGFTFLFFEKDKISFSDKLA